MLMQRKAQIFPFLVLFFFWLTLFGEEVVAGAEISTQDSKQNQTIVRDLSFSEDDILVSTFSLPDDLDDWYQQENARLLKICKVYSSKCFSKHGKPKEWNLGAVYGGPDNASNIIGQIAAVIHVKKEVDEGMAMRLDFVPNGTTKHLVWIDDVRDWGYGIHHHVLKQKGDWVMLPLSPFPPSSWINIRNTQFTGDVSSIKGSIMNLQSVNAVIRKTRLDVSVPADNYLIEDINAGKVIFRKEIPSDMPCEEEIKPPKNLPESYESNRSNFFNQDGSPRFSLVYERGC
ncbi:MAG: hypothetical protein V4568_05455 [Pseudomonadota bacterium]